MYFVIIYKKIKEIIVLLLTDKCGGGYHESEREKDDMSTEKGRKR